MGDLNLLEINTTTPQMPQSTSPRAIGAPRSLGKQLAIHLLVVLTVVLTASSLVLYISVRKKLYHQFDLSLVNRAASFSLLIEQEVKGIVFEWDEHDENPESQHQMEWFQVWLTDGTSLSKSVQLGDAELPRISNPDIGKARYINCTLPNGDLGRAIGAMVFAKREGDLTPEISPIAVDVVVAHSLSDVHLSLAALRRTLIATWTASILLSSVTMIWVVRRACRPLEGLSQKIQNLDESRLHHQLDTANLPIELVPVVDRLNGLMKRLAKAFETEKQLTVNVAHELRTPLSGLRTTLEVAVSCPREDAEHHEIEHECLEITCQLQALVETVLSLGKIGSGTIIKKIKNTDSIDLMRQCWSTLADHIQLHDLGIVWNTAESLFIHTDPDLLRIVISNLFDNAVTYATDNSTVQVHAHQQGDRLQISIANDTEGVTPRHVQHAFEPFWRGDAARASTGTNAGLGLSLCQKLMSVIGGTIKLSCEEGKTFRVDLELVDHTPDSVINSTFHTTGMK